MLFNKYHDGGKELRELLGFIDANTNFDKWLTWINLSLRQITELTGTEILKQAETYYNQNSFGSHPEEKEYLLVKKFQLTNALFAYVKMIPSLDAGHGNDGRKKGIGENEKELTALEQYKDEANILNLAYEALEDLLIFLEEQRFEAWENAPVKQMLKSLVITKLSEFNEYFTLGSSRMFFTMLPMIREVQEMKVVPAVTRTRMTALLEAMKAAEPSDEQKELLEMLPLVRRPLVLASLALAIKRLPVEVLPDGIVQTQITGSIREKRIAAKEASRAVIDSLTDDAHAAFSVLQDYIAGLEGEDMTERYVVPPSQKDGVKGFLF